MPFGILWSPTNKLYDNTQPSEQAEWLHPTGIHFQDTHAHMVQFIFTPWRDRAELLRVRSQFYPSSSSSSSSSSSAAAAFPTTAAGDLSSQPPWRTPAELAAVEQAIARVFMWVHRGHCPHVVESTALLLSALVLDAAAAPPHNNNNNGAVAGAAVRASYLVAFTRFVTGLLDGHQDKARKLSMYGVAKTIGLPAGFVELRHQGTHEPMPSLAQLRPAARRALGWIWEYYWKNLAPASAAGELQEEDGAEDVEATAVVAAGKKGKQQQASTTTTTTTIAATTTITTTTSSSRSSGLQERMCRAALMGYLQRPEGDVGATAAKEGLMRQLRQWDTVLVVRVLAEAGAATRDRGLLARAVKLSREILGRGDLLDLDLAREDGAGAGEEDGWRLELSRARAEVEGGLRAGRGSSTLLGKRKQGEGQQHEEEEDEDEEEGGDGGTGWFEWKGPWIPRPIGCL